MQLSDMRDYVYDFLQQTTSKGIVSQTEMERYIHDGHMRMFQQVAELMERFCWTQELLDEAENQTNYFLPSDCYRMLFLERVKAGNANLNVPYFIEKLESVTPMNIDWFRNNSTTPRGNNESYYQTGQKGFILLEASSQTQTEAFRATYIFRPAQMTANGHYPFRRTADLSTDPDASIPDGSGVDDLRDYHDIIPLYALEMCLMKEQDPVAMSIQAKRKERESELRNFLNSTNIQKPTHINYTRWDEDQFAFLM